MRENKSASHSAAGGRRDKRNEAGQAQRALHIASKRKRKEEGKEKEKGKRGKRKRGEEGRGRGGGCAPRGARISLASAASDKVSGRICKLLNHFRPRWVATRFEGHFQKHTQYRY